LQEYRQLLQNAKLELKKSKRKDYYKILGIARGASDEEIKRAYRKRALAHHPGEWPQTQLQNAIISGAIITIADRHSGSSEEEKREHEKKFKEIGEAYGVLSDSKKKSRYDNGCDIEDLEGGCGHGYSDIDPNQIFQVRSERFRMA
jgi:DnaJ family protein C protein 7